MTKPKVSTALVVVDMQTGYIGEGSVLDNTLQLVEGAVKDSVPIIFLEIPGHGAIHRCLIKAAAGYRKKKLKRKRAADGSRQVREACKAMRIQPEHFVVCGVNYRICVWYTIIGIRLCYPDSKITLVKEATNCSGKPYATFENFELLAWKE